MLMCLFLALAVATPEPVALPVEVVVAPAPAASGLPPPAAPLFIPESQGGPAVAVPLPTAQEVREGSKAIAVLLDAAARRELVLALGALLTVLVIVVRRLARHLGREIPPEMAKYVSLFLAAAPAIAAAFSANQVPWDQLINVTLEFWVLSAGVWSLGKSAAKQVRRKK